MNNSQPTTMYIQNRRDSSKFKGCSPLQNRNGLISLKPAIAYFAYTQRCAAYKRRANAQAKSAIAHIAFCQRSKKTNFEKLI